MGESNDAWGEFAEESNEFRDAWDQCERLPEPGENLVLDAFCKRKRIDIRSLLRLGAKLADGDVLAFAYERGIKFRNMVDGKMWSFLGSEWPRMKIIRAGADPTPQIIVCEGETDGARLSKEYKTDVGVMPGGAVNFPETMGAQLDGYAEVLMGLDKDEAGEAGCEKIESYHGNTTRFVPRGSGDWCDVDDLPPLPEVSEALVKEPEKNDLSSEIMVAAGQMLEMEVPDIISWYEHALLPIGGLLIAHGWAKSFKSFTMLDMLARLAQGLDWCCFEPTEEPVKTCAIQFEIPWPYYHERISILQREAVERKLFDENFFTWTPMRRPELIAGKRKSEDKILKGLVENGIQVALIDPIRRATGSADLNAENEVRRMLAFFERLQNEGITVVATHHDNKEGAKAGGGNSLAMTGSGAFAGDPDTIIGVEIPRGEDIDTSPRRNFNFVLRNAPAIGPRSMEISEDGLITYDNEPITDEPEEVEPGAPTTPSI